MENSFRRQDARFNTVEALIYWVWINIYKSQKLFSRPDLYDQMLEFFKKLIPSF